MSSLKEIASLDRAARWDLVERIIDLWFPPPPVGTPPGCHPSEVEAAETRLGFPLPSALREWYVRFGNLSHVWSCQDNLISPDALVEKNRRIVIMRENQNVVQWSIEAPAESAPDPPVMVSDLDQSGRLHLAASSISEFAIQTVLLGAKFSDRDGLFHANGGATESAVTALATAFPRLPFVDLHWPPFPARIYGDESLVVEIDGGAWIWIAARNESSFRRALEIAEDAGVEWESLLLPPPEGPSKE